jgi:LPXTG-motif cell wall-anchored protein
MKLPKTGIQRKAALILIGLFGGFIVIIGYSVFLKLKKPTMISIDKALYVSDWDITTIYGPGTPQQKAIVIQMDKDLKFDAPVLYRIGGSSAGNPSDGYFLYGFDPRRPERAKEILSPSNQRITPEAEQDAPRNR